MISGSTNLFGGSDVMMPGEVKPKLEIERQRTGTEAGPAKGAKGPRHAGTPGGTAEVIPLDTFRKK